MELTVCICVRDGAAYVDRCLRALIDATQASGVPIVVVDHASRDRTPELLARWGRDYPARIRILSFGGEGLAAVRNFAWRSATTPWIAFVDIDCEVQPGWAEAVLEGIRAHAEDPNCGAFGGTNRAPAGGGWLARACAVFLPTFIGGHGSILNRPASAARRVDHCPTLNVVYRRGALEAIDGFDPAYTRLGEDLDVSWRLTHAGYTLWANPPMAVEHAPRSTVRSWLHNMFMYGRGRCFYLKRHPDAFEWKFFAPPAMVFLYGLVLMVDLVSGGRPVPGLVGLAVVHVVAIAALLVGEAHRQGAGVGVWLSATLVVWLTHLAYGLGILAELPRRRDRFVV